MQYLYGTENAKTLDFLISFNRMFPQHWQNIQNCLHTIWCTKSNQQQHLTCSVQVFFPHTVYMPKRCRRSKCTASNYIWEECDEFLHVEPNTQQSSEVGSVHPLNCVSTNDVPSWNSNDHVSHTARWSYVRTSPSVSHHTSQSCCIKQSHR